MAFYIMGEPKYRMTNWYRENLCHLNDLLHKKRIPNAVITNISDLKQHTLSDTDALLLFSTDTQWICETVKQFEPYFDNRIIIYGHNDSIINIYPNKFNTISYDLNGEINTIYNYLTFYGKKKIALYGITPDAVSDEIRKKYYLSFGNKESDIYYHRNSLEQCFDDFICHINHYDAVICANPCSAISLVNKLGNKRKIFIACCGSTSLFELPFFPSITHTYSTTESSNIALAVYRMLLSNRMVSAINVYLPKKLFVGETTDFLPLPDKNDITTQPAFKNNLVFYSDREVKELLGLEQLISSCDEIDLVIIERILENATYSQISDELFMSTNGIKYKLKKMFSACNVSSKSELCELLRKYMSKSKELSR